MSRKTPMTEKEFMEKSKLLGEKSAALQQELLNLKKRIKSNEEEMQRIEEEFIISNFRSNNISAVEFVTHMGNLKNNDIHTPVNTPYTNEQTEKRPISTPENKYISYTSKEDKFNGN